MGASPESEIVLSLSKVISSKEYHTLKAKTDLSVMARDITKIVSGLRVAVPQRCGERVRRNWKTYLETNHNESFIADVSRVYKFLSNSRRGHVGDNISADVKVSYIGITSALGELLRTYIGYVHCGMLPLIDNAENMMGYDWRAPVIAKDVQACMNAIFKDAPYDEFCESAKLVNDGVAPLAAAITCDLDGLYQIVGQQAQDKWAYVISKNYLFMQYSGSAGVIRDLLNSGFIGASRASRASQWRWYTVS